MQSDSVDPVRHPCPSISACFPAYNDAGTIPSMVLAAIITLRSLTDDFEIIVCNDGSTDHTAGLLEELATRCPELTVIHHAKNQGYGLALRSTFSRAQKDFIFYTDGDAQYDPRELALLVDKLVVAPRSLATDQPEPRYAFDVINGYKISRNDPWHRIVIGRLYHHLMRWLFGFTIRDVDCDFRLIRRALLQSLPLAATDGTLPLELVTRLTGAGARFAEVPVHHFHRVYGTSQFFNVRRLLRVVRDIYKLRRTLKKTNHV